MWTAVSKMNFKLKNRVFWMQYVKQNFFALSRFECRWVQNPTSEIDRNSIIFYIRSPTQTKSYMKPTFTMFFRVGIVGSHRTLYFCSPLRLYEELWYFDWNDYLSNIYSWYYVKIVFKFFIGLIVVKKFMLLSKMR